MLQSHAIEVDGASVGAAIRIDRGYCFVAVDYRLGELDKSIWPTLDDVQRVARRYLKAATPPGPTPAVPHAHAATHELTRNGYRYDMMINRGFLVRWLAVMHWRWRRWQWSIDIEE